MLEMWFDVIFLSCGPRHITPAPLFHFAIRYFKSHHIGHIMHCTLHCTPFHITFHIMPHSIYSTPHFRLHYILAIVMHRTSTSRTTDTTLHRISQAAPHVLHNCIVPSHQTVVTPSSTSHYHVSHNFPHHTSVHHHILHRTTCHISHNTISTTRSVTEHTLPHSTSHNVPHSMPQHTLQSILHNHHNPIPV